MQPLLAAIWLLGLFAAAPLLRSGERYDLTDRLRDTLILGAAIPFFLGIVHLLYVAACFSLLGICIVFSAIRSDRSRTLRDAVQAQPAYVLIAALFAVAWPQLTRPLLDGDSLSYHLPNAAAWVQAHSLWTTATRYWWYPPASELFASGVYAAGGPFALPWSGLCALALLGARVFTWSRDAFNASPLFADALAAATVSAYPLAIQGGTLQNDVWLAAFWLETLWLLRRGSADTTALPTVAVSALIKPQGWLFTAIALIARKAKPQVWCAAAGALGAWLIHDAILAKYALISPAASAAYTNAFGSTILAHGAAALALLVKVAASVSPFALLALCAALLGPSISRADRRLGWAALVAGFVFFILPFGYETNVAQLANGASLRFAAPAISAGALLFTGLTSRFRGLATGALLASTAFGIWYVLAIFWNDGSTHVALAMAALAPAISAATRRAFVWLKWVAVGIAIALATHLAGRHPLDYYNDALRVNGATPGVYRWLRDHHPASVGGVGLRLGVVNVLSPETKTRDLVDDAACTDARSTRALLVAVAQNDLNAATNERRLAAAHACGRTLYGDSIGVVARPR